IGKAGEDTTLHRSGLDLAGLQVKTFIPSNCEKLLSQLRGFPGRTGIYPELCTTLRIKAAVFRVAKCTHQDEKVGCGVAAKHIFAVFACLFAFEAAQE